MHKKTKFVRETRQSKETKICKMLTSVYCIVLFKNAKRKVEKKN